MVTALRSGPPPISPAQPGRPTDAARMEAGRTAQLSDARQASAPETPRQVPATDRTDPARAARPSRPGSVLDIRV